VIVCGIDVGSRNVSAVILKDDDIISYCVLTSGEKVILLRRR